MWDSNRWNYAKMKCIQIHFSHTLKILVHRSQEANAVRCKVVLTIYYFACNLYNWTRRARPSPWPQSTPQSVLPSASHRIWTMTRFCVQHWSFVLYSHLGVDTEAETGNKTVSAQWISFRPSQRQLEADPCQAATAAESNKEPGKIGYKRTKSTNNKNLFKIWGIPMIRQDMFSRYCVQDAKGIMSGFVAAIPTMEEDCDCWTDLTVWSLYTNIYFRNS